VVVLFGKAVVLALINQIAGVCSSAASDHFASDRRPSSERCFGLGQYETSFRENNIDESVLPNLTAEDLKDLGIATVGHHQKLLDAISAGP
jgi:hypothetical protein